MKISCMRGLGLGLGLGFSHITGLGDSTVGVLDPQKPSIRMFSCRKVSTLPKPALQPYTLSRLPQNPGWEDKGREKSFKPAAQTRKTVDYKPVGVEMGIPAIRLVISGSSETPTSINHSFI